MYCPKCRSEFREGFERCGDCDVGLVEILPEERVKPGYVQVATLFTEGEIALVKASLDRAGIDYYLHGEQAHRLTPLPFGARLMVRQDYVEEAEGLLGGSNPE